MQQGPVVDHYTQLTNYNFAGSPLFKSILSLASRKPEMTLFSQRQHYQKTIEQGIERFIYPVSCDASAFSNLHGFLPEAFEGEFDRGMNCYLKSFEIIHQDVVQTHIIDFVERFIAGQELLEPRFKHDLLDIKHFTSGIASNRFITFADGKMTFRELVLRCLYAIEQKKNISINSQLLLDTVCIFLKTLQSAGARDGETSQSNSLAAEKINTTGYTPLAIAVLTEFINQRKPHELAYIRMCVNLIRFRLDKKFIQQYDLADPLAAIRQKLDKSATHHHSDKYFTILPPPPPQ